MDSFATAISLSLQYGVPLQVLADKFSHTRFEPSGFTGNPQIPIAKSVSDYIFRWLGMKFLPADERPFDPSALQGEMFPPEKPRKAPQSPGVRPAATTSNPASAAAAPSWNPTRAAAVAHRERQIFVTQADAPSCASCGSLMI